MIKTKLSHLTIKPILPLLFIAFFLTGCAHFERIKDVKSIAVVGVKFDRQIIKVNRSGQDGKLDMLQLIGGQVLGIKELRDQDKDFFDSFHQALLGVFEAEGFSLLPGSEYKDNAYYKSIMENIRETNRIIHYMPGAGRYVDVIKNKTISKELCKELGVDAVASFEFKFMRFQEKILFKIPGERLGLQGVFSVVDKDGVIIFKEKFVVKAEENQIKLLEAMGGVSITTNNKAMFESVTHQFVQLLQNKIREAKRQAGI